MYFEFDDYRPDIAPVGRAISWREGVLISIILHLGLVIFILVAPRLLPARSRGWRSRSTLAQAQTESPRFVFVQPRLDTPAPKPPPRAPLIRSGSPGAGAASRRAADERAAVLARQQSRTDRRAATGAGRGRARTGTGVRAARGKAGRTGRR